METIYGHKLYNIIYASMNHPQLTGQYAECG